MSIKVMAAAVATAAGLAVATCGPACAAPGGALAQLTGTQLLAALVPASDFPAGYTLDKSSTYDTGSHLLTAPAKYHLATMSCVSFGTHFGTKGFGETAIAADSFSSADFGRGFGQQVYQFRTAGAASAFFSGLRAIPRRCPQFVLTQPGVNAKVATVVASAAPIAGHRTFQVHETGTFLGVKIGLSFVFTVAGTDVFIAGNLGVHGAPPASPSPRTTMARLIKRVRSAD